MLKSKKKIEENEEITVVSKPVKDNSETKNAFQINEINANLMLSKMYLFLSICGVILIVFGIVGVDAVATPKVMIIGGILFALTSLIYVFVRKCNGEKYWCKHLITWTLLSIVFPFCCAVGNFTVLMLVLPIVMSIRYCNKKLTLAVSIGSIIAMIAAVYIHPLIAGVDPSFYPFASGTVITIDTDIESALAGMNLDMASYLKTLGSKELMPKFFAFLFLSILSINIAKSGRAMTELQASISENSSRIETELTLATQIQAGMLPCVFPAFPEHEQIDLYACNVPAKEVGGDFYDYFRVDDDHIAIVMADVSGKGVGAALFMSISKIIIQNLMRFSNDIGQAMTESNASLCANNTAGMFVTAWVGVYEISTGIMSYVNAGHNPPVLIKKDQPAEYLAMAHNFILAMMDGFKYQSGTIQIDAGDELFLYTDGVTEANDINGDMYGERRLLDCLNKVKSESSEAQVSKIHQDIEAFEKGADQFDDITMLCLKVN